MRSRVAGRMNRSYCKINLLILDNNVLCRQQVQIGLPPPRWLAKLEVSLLAYTIVASQSMLVNRPNKPKAILGLRPHRPVGDPVGQRTDGPKILDDASTQNFSGPRPHCVPRRPASGYETRLDSSDRRR